MKLRIHVPLCYLSEIVGENICVRGNSSHTTRHISAWTRLKSTIQINTICPISFLVQMVQEWDSTNSTYSSNLYIFSEKITSSKSLLTFFLSAANSTPSEAKIPRHVPAWPMASIAYSTWYNRPGETGKRQNFWKQMRCVYACKAGKHHWKHTHVPSGEKMFVLVSYRRSCVQNGNRKMIMQTVSFSRTGFFTHHSPFLSKFSSLWLRNTRGFYGSSKKI